MKRKLMLLSLLLGLAASLVTGAAALAQQGKLSGELIRLHVIAASDDPADQARKLLVRDAVLEALAQQPQAESAEEAAVQLRAVLPELAETASAALEEAGHAEAVSVRLCTESYPTRDYGTFALPAGEYASLQIVIGEGAGHNWWCVVYPSLCTAATSAQVYEAAEAAGFDEDELHFLQVDTASVRFGFKFLEIWQKIKSFF